MSVSNTPVLEPLQPPPMAVMAQQAAYTAHSGHGSFGPVIGALAVITILCALSVMIGRLCSGRRIMGYQGYDFERWVEIKCSSCIDGSFNSYPPPRMVAEHRVSSSSDAAPPLETPSEAAEEQVEVAEQHTTSQDEHHPHEKSRVLKAIISCGPGRILHSDPSHWFDHVNVQLSSINCGSGKLSHLKTTQAPPSRHRNLPPSQFIISEDP